MSICYLPLLLIPPQCGQLFLSLPASSVPHHPQPWHPSSTPVRGRDPLIPPRIGLLTLWTRCFHFTPPSTHPFIYLYILLLYISTHQLPAICLSVDVMILRRISALQSRSSGLTSHTRSYTSAKPPAVHHTCLSV